MSMLFTAIACAIVGATLVLCVVAVVRLRVTLSGCAYDLLRLHEAVYVDMQRMERRIAALERHPAAQETVQRPVTGRYAELDRELAAAEEATNVYIDDLLRGIRK